MHCDSKGKIQILENVAFLTPLRGIKYNSGVYLVLFRGLNKLKSEIGNSLIFENSPLKSDLDIGDVQILVSDIDKLINTLVRILTLPVLHR